MDVILPGCNITFLEQKKCGGRRVLLGYLVSTTVVTVCLLLRQCKLVPTPPASVATPFLSAPTTVSARESY